MNAMTGTLPTIQAPARRLKALLAFDAFTCIVGAALLLALTAPLSTLLGLSPGLLQGAGLLLIPCGLLMVLAARQQPPHAALVLTIVGGNLLWTLASLAIAFLVPGLTAIGQAVVVLQALAVLGLAVLEGAAFRRQA